MEELKNKEGINEESEEEKYLSDYEEENDILCQTNYYDNINNIKKVVVIKKFNVYFYLNFNKSKQYVIPVYTENFNIYETRIYDLIKYIVKKINNSNIIIKDNNIDYSVSIKDTEEEDNIDFYINNYKIKPFEFWTKNDCIDFSPNSLIKSINEENISFFAKNPLNIMLIEKF